MNTTVKISMVIVFILLGCVNATYSQDFKKESWLEDFVQLKKELSDHYANLDYAINVRKLDLKQLSEKTTISLSQSKNEVEAKKILESFLDAFGDGHLYVEWNANKSQNSLSSAVINPASQVPLCDRLRFQNQNTTWRIGFPLLETFKEIKTEDSKYFSIGILNLGPKKDVGILRISIFSQYAFTDLCQQITSGMNLNDSSVCDERCEDLIEQKTANLLTAALARQIEILKKKNIATLLVDISGNGGGTNWVEAAARTLTAKPLNSPRQQFIRHEHWTKQLKERLEIIQVDTSRLTFQHIKLKASAENILEHAIVASQQPCDRSAVWENGTPPCSIIVTNPTLYPQSILSYAKPRSLPNTAYSEFLFYPSRYAYEEGVYKGRVIILVDRGTWSSAEYFAAMFRDNNSAMIIGEPTGGAGCGFTDGGIQTFLKNSGAKIKIPDCVRLRSDGTNEVAGITPDVIIPWRVNDSRYQRARRVFDVLYEQENRKTKKKSNLTDN